MHCQLSMHSPRLSIKFRMRRRTLVEQLLRCIQVALHRILTSWGDAGLEDHLRAVQAIYWRRASTLHQAAVAVRVTSIVHVCI